MSTTLSLTDCLFSQGQKLHEIGRRRDACVVLGKLSKVRGLGREATEQTRAELAEICLELGLPADARKHVRVAMACSPNRASLLYLMAKAYDQDDTSERFKALSYYRQSLKLEPDNTECLIDFGLLAIEHDDVEEGLAALRRAVDLSPEDPEILGCLVQSLVSVDQIDEAQRLVQAARFTHGKNPAFSKLWSDFQFQILRCQQEARIPEFARADDDRLKVLPFQPGSGSSSQKTIRHDQPSLPRPPHAPRLALFTGKKHA